MQRPGLGGRQAKAEQILDLAEEDAGQPKTTEILARVYDKLYWVLGLTFGILALGGTLLFRKGAV